MQVRSHYSYQTQTTKTFPGHKNRTLRTIHVLWILYVSSCSSLTNPDLRTLCNVFEICGLPTLKFPFRSLHTSSGNVPLLPSAQIPFSPCGTEAASQALPLLPVLSSMPCYMPSSYVWQIRLENDTPLPHGAVQPLHDRNNYQCLHSFPLPIYEYYSQIFSPCPLRLSKESCPAGFSACGWLSGVETAPVRLWPKLNIDRFCNSIENLPTLHERMRSIRMRPDAFFLSYMYGSASFHETQAGTKSICPCRYIRPGQNMQLMERILFPCHI